MEDIGINWSPPLRGAPRISQWQMDNSTMQHISIFVMLGILFYWCINVKISTTKYMRGRDISI